MELRSPRKKKDKNVTPENVSSPKSARRSSVTAVNFPGPSRVYIDAPLMQVQPQAILVPVYPSHRFALVGSSSLPKIAPALSPISNVNTKTTNAIETINPSTSASVSVTQRLPTSNIMHVPQQITAWNEMAKQPILIVTCKNILGHLYKDVFGSGSRGKCILLNEIWYTPNGFEHICGKGSCRDWRRSIRFGIVGLDVLIEGGFLTVHSVTCMCAICNDGNALTEPVKQATPKKPRKKAVKKKETKSTEAVIKTEVVDIAPIFENNNYDEADTSFRSDASNSSFVVTTNDLIPLMDKLEVIDQHIEMLTYQVQRCLDDIQLNAMDNMGYQSQQQPQGNQTVIVSPGEFHPQVEDNVDTIDVKFARCVNCDREANNPCPRCLQVSYCSEFCLARDWTAHEEECKAYTQPC